MCSPSAVLVVTPEAAVAVWARKPVEVAPGGSVFRALVLGAESVPVIVDDAVAAHAPELAVLSALAHGGEEVAEHIGKAAVRATARLDVERRTLSGTSSTWRSTKPCSGLCWARPSQLIAAHPPLQPESHTAWIPVMSANRVTAFGVLWLLVAGCAKAPHDSTDARRVDAAPATAPATTRVPANASRDAPVGAEQLPVPEAVARLHRNAFSDAAVDPKLGGVLCVVTLHDAALERGELFPLVLFIPDHNPCRFSLCTGYNSRISYCRKHSHYKRHRHDLS